MSRKQLQRRLVMDAISSLDEGLSVEDLIDAVCMAVWTRLRESSSTPDARYRRELSIFYRRTLSILSTARKEVSFAGDVAKAESYRR